MAALVEGALDAYWRWFWYPLTEVVGTVTGLRRLEQWYRARTRARREMQMWALVVDLDRAGLGDSAALLSGNLAKRHGRHPS
jgi:hypothetical protein